MFWWFSHMLYGCVLDGLAQAFIYPLDSGFGNATQKNNVLRPRVKLM